MYISIKTKFILLISVVIALVLVLQFYFTSQTQKDIFNELSHLSSSINELNYEFFVNDSTNGGLDSLLNSLENKYHLDSNSISYGPNAEDKVIKKHIREYEHFIDDSLKKSELDSIFKRLKTSFSINKDQHFMGLNGQMKIVATLHNQLKDSIHASPVNGFDFDVEIFSLKDDSALTKSQRKIWLNKKGRDGDSLALIIEEITSAAKKAASALPISKISGGKTNKTISFIVPGIGSSNNPKIVKYNYSFSSIDNVLKRTRQKNMIVMAIIFIFAVILVVIITKRFLKPIDDLKTSFGRVVDGNLSMLVKKSSNDEIGDLTDSFNYMVRELRKNKQKQELLARKERLASLGQLAAGVAHEIKNPLNAINLTIEHLDDKYIPKDNKSAKQYIRTIREEIRRLDRIVNNFLSYLRTEKLELEKVDVKLFFENIIRLYERELVKKNIETEINIDDGFILELDPAKMRTAVSNIILNAIQAMGENGRLIIRGSRKGSIIKIADSGKGMSKDEIRKIFDLFYTTKSSGSGLGLPTTYKIFKAHKAEINIESEPDKGTTVTITFAEQV